MPDRGFVLGVDLDGVCGDYTGALARVVAEDRGIEVAELGPQLSWDFAEWGLSEGDFERLHRQAVDDHLFASMTPMAGAAEVLWRLSDAGVWVRIITHRLALNWAHAVVVADTVSWLDAHGFPYRDLCFLGAKPEVEADVYVDDAPHNVEALRARGNRVIVFDHPYNRHLDGPRATDWGVVETEVADIAAELDRPLQGQLPGLEWPQDRLARRLSP